MILDSGTWDDEVALWAPDIDATQVSYDSLSGRVRTERGGTRPSGELKPEYKRKWGTIILDESHYIKSRKSTRTKMVQQLVKLTDHLYLLTGTPIPNWAYEAYMPLKLIWDGDIRFRSYWRWINEWFETQEQSWLRYKPIEIKGLREGLTWEKFREENWGDRVLLRTREECLDLPPVTRQTWRVSMTPAQQRVYKALKKDFIAWLDSGEEIAAFHESELLHKLLKAATGLDCFDKENHNSGKFDALQSIIEDRPRPTLVVGHYRSSISAATDRCLSLGRSTARIDGSTSKAQRREIIHAFQRGEIDVLCATLGTISEGLTLVAADQIVFLERSWRPSRNEQALRRIHRIGQSHPVIAIDLVTRDSIDERMLKVLAEKTDQQMKALGIAELKGLI